MKRWACIARMGGVGDNLVAASTLRPLKRMGYMTEVLTSKLASPVFLNNPFIDKLTIKDDEDIPHGANNEYQKWFHSRSKEYDIFAHLAHSMEVRHAVHPDNVMFWHRPEYRRQVLGGSYLETAHDIVGVPHEFGPMFFPTEEEKANVKAVTDKSVGGRYAVWVLAGSRIDKKYTYSPIAIGRIIKELGIPIIVTGWGQQQWDMAEQIREMVERQNSSRDMLYIAVSHDGQPLEQRFPLRISLTTAMLSSLVITPDTGPGWATAMEAMPKVVMVSHASAENITKHWVNTTTLHADPMRVPCWPCHRLHNDPSTCMPDKDNKGAACMSDISVDTVVAAVDKAWNADSHHNIWRDNIITMGKAS